MECIYTVTNYQPNKEKDEDDDDMDMGLSEIGRRLWGNGKYRVINRNTGKGIPPLDPPGLPESYPFFVYLSSHLVYHISI